MEGEYNVLKIAIIFKSNIYLYIQYFKYTSNIIYKIIKNIYNHITF